MHCRDDTIGGWGYISPSLPQINFVIRLNSRRKTLQSGRRLLSYNSLLFHIILVCHPLAAHFFVRCTKVRGCEAT